MKFKEIEKILKTYGWHLKSCRGSHNHYVHPTKIGKVTIPNRGGDIDKKTLSSILKQAGLK